jgi:hypothetical protein
MSASPRDIREAADYLETGSRGALLPADVQSGVRMGLRMMRGAADRIEELEAELAKAQAGVNLEA